MGTQLISTVTTGTAQLQVAPTTAVPNLNAAFWAAFQRPLFRLGELHPESYDTAGWQQLQHRLQWESGWVG